jgi:hypothetical protein
MTRYGPPPSAVARGERLAVKVLRLATAMSLLALISVIMQVRTEQSLEGR